MTKITKNTKYRGWLRPGLLAGAILVASVSARAEDAEGQGPADDLRKPPEASDSAVRRFSSKKSAEEKAADEGRGPKIGSPHGPAMDGVRGSAIAPVPGAFGTDAGSPDDLRR